MSACRSEPDIDGSNTHSLVSLFMRTGLDRYSVKLALLALTFGFAFTIIRYADYAVQRSWTVGEWFHDTSSFANILVQARRSASGQEETFRDATDEVCS